MPALFTTTRQMIRPSSLCVHMEASSPPAHWTTAWHRPPPETMKTSIPRTSPLAASYRMSVNIPATGTGGSWAEDTPRPTIARMANYGR